MMKRLIAATLLFGGSAFGAQAMRRVPAIALALALCGPASAMMQSIVADTHQGGGGGNDCTGAGTIAFDATSCAITGCGNWGWDTNSGAVRSWATHTITGSNTALTVKVITDTFSADPTGVTWNGVAMTKVASVAGAVESHVQETSLWVLAGAATGTHTIQVTWASDPGLFAAAVAESYTGVNQTSPVFSSATGVNNSAANSFSLGTTTNGTKCWLIGAVFSRGGNSSAGTGTTFRDLESGTIESYDSNGTVASGTPTLAFTGSSITWPGVIVAALAPTP